MSRYKVVVYILVLVGIFDASVRTTSQRLREMAREHARKKPGIPLQIPAPPRDYSPKTIEEVTAEAEVVLQARLTRIRSYLSANGNYIATDYSVRDARVISGQLAIPSSKIPGAVVPLTLTEWGGEATVDGVLIRGIETSRAAIKDGAEYVLFLRAARPDFDLGRYEIYHGAVFTVTGDKVEPLLHQADAVFKGTVDGSRRALITRIVAATRGR